MVDEMDNRQLAEDGIIMKGLLLLWLGMGVQVLACAWDARIVVYYDDCVCVVLVGRDG